MDYVTLEQFKIQSIHGHFEHERNVEQEFEVSLKVGFDIAEAGKSDKLPHTLDFDFLRKCVETVFAQKKYYLVEAIAEEIAEKVLVDMRAQEVTVSIKKNAVWPDAIPGVIITRRK